MTTSKEGYKPPRASRRLRKICSAVIISWEHALQSLHSFLYLLLFYPYRPSQRAWWDPAKGTAVVISAPNNDAVARFIALRLSTGSPSSLAFAEPGPSHGRAPYTCFVLHSDPDQFAITVAQWAAKKAQLERTRSRQTEKPSSTSPGSDDEDPTSAERQKSRQSRPSLVKTKSSTASDKRRRSLSWSSWVKPPDLFGYGADMLKGWRPGQGSTRSESAGTIIPIMVDLQTQVGVSMVTSTISAYCTSYNLLLSGVILVPSVLCPRNVEQDQTLDDTASGGSGKSPASPSQDPSSPSASDIYSPMPWNATGSTSPPAPRLKQTQDDEFRALRSALLTDVLQARALLNALYPALTRDKGRIVAFVPSGHGCTLPMRSAKTYRSEEQSLREWPSSVINTVRDALRRQYADMSLDYAKRARTVQGTAVSLSTIETQTLIKPPLNQCKKSVQWDRSLNDSTPSSASVFDWLVSAMPFLSPRSPDDKTDKSLHTFHRDPFSLMAQLLSAILLRALTVLQWLKMCTTPFDDLSELVQAVSEPVLFQTQRADHQRRVPSTHQDPTPLLEAIRSALTSHNPRSTYTPSLAASMSSYTQLLAPWMHSHLKNAVANFILATADHDFC